MTPRLPSLVCTLCLVASAAHAWNGADDERRRQRALAQWPSNVARLERDDVQALRAAQTTWSRNRLAFASASRNTADAAATAAATTTATPPARSAIALSTPPPLGTTLAALRTQAGLDTGKARARQWYQQAANADNPMAVQRLRGKP